MKIKGFNMTLFHMLWGVVMFFELSSTAGVHVIITSNEVTDQELPNDINLEITVDANKTFQLHLNLVGGLNRIPVYTVDSVSQHLKINQETLDDNEIAGVYQDTKHEAVVVLVKQDNTDGQGYVEKFRVKRGEYLHNGARYSIQPIIRSKRETHLDLNQSVHIYDIKPLASSSDAKSKGYIQPDFGTKVSETLEKNNMPYADAKRKKRDAFATYYIDLAAFVDYTCYKYFLEESLNNTDLAMLKIREYYAFIFAGVDLIYQNLMAIDFRLRIKLAKLVILKDSTTIPLVYSKRYTNVVDGVQVVLNFRSFLRNNLGFSYDHATLFLRTGFVQDNTTEFLSTVMGFPKALCDLYGSSSSLVYDIQNYQVTLYVAQAIAFSLSANLDGVDNICSSQDNYLMGSTDENITESAKLNAWKFSNCTLKYFVDFIQVLKSTAYGQQCLTKTLPVSEEFPDVSQRLLGQEVSPDEQCRLSTRNSNFRQQFSNGTFPNICTELVCVNSQNKSEVFVISALSGTSCGCGKVCTQGQCVSEPLFANIDCNVKDVWANCTLTLCLDNGVSKFCQNTCANYLMYSSITTTVKTSTSTTTVKTSTPPSSTSPTPKTMSAITSTAATTSKNSTGTLCQDITFFTYNDLNCYNAMLTAQNLCYEASVQTSCCASCAQRSVNIPGCKYGDRDKSLCSSIPSCKGQETNCCQTCRVNTAGRLLPGGIFLLTFNIAACILVFLISLT